MALIYSRRTVFANAALECIASFLLYPLKKRPDGRPIRRILLVEPFGMGDVLSLSVMLNPLKAAYPDAEIRLLTKQGNEQIYATDPRVGRTYTISAPWSRLSGHKRGACSEWAEIWKICREIAKWDPDVGLDSRSEIRSQILMVLAGCRKRIGFKNYLNTNINVRGWLLTDVVEKPPVMHRYAMNRLLSERGLGIEPAPVKFPSFKPQIPAERISGGAFQVLIHIGARWKYRQWPEKNWIDLGNRLIQAGIRPIIVGSRDEQNTISVITDAIRGAQPVCADMVKLIALVKGSDLFIGLDSGPMHLAQTLGIPVVALFGPGDVELWHPQGELDQMLFHRLPCNPCLQKTCIRPHDSCMPKITVEETFEAVMKVLASISERHRS